MTQSPNPFGHVTMPAATAHMVLLVEDDPQYQEALRWALEDAGLQVDAATDLREALGKSVDQPPSVAVIDVWLPGGEGSLLAEELRRRYGDQFPIITITADENIEAKARQMGAVGWLRKPFNMDNLVRAVNDALNPGA
jgi:DNA-binding response OmpR family regulator